jgi:hypothetical protein
MKQTMTEASVRGCAGEFHETIRNQARRPGSCFRAEDVRRFNRSI